MFQAIWIPKPFMRLQKRMKRYKAVQFRHITGSGRRDAPYEERLPLADLDAVLVARILQHALPGAQRAIGLPQLRLGPLHPRGEGGRTANTPVLRSEPWGGGERF